MSTFLTFIGVLVLGWHLGQVGKEKKWGLLKTIVIFSALGAVWGLVMSLVSLQFSQASEKEAHEALVENTVHINYGTGFILVYKGNKYLITNWHVCNASNQFGIIQGSFQDGNSVRGPIVKQDFKSDLCAVKVLTDKRGIAIAKVAWEGDKVYTRGYPEHVLSESEGRLLYLFNWDYIYRVEEVGICPPGSHPVRATNGVVAGCKVTYRSRMSTIYSRPGSSGSAVVNEEGKLVGVVSSCEIDEEKKADHAGLVDLEQVKHFLGGL